MLKSMGRGPRSLITAGLALVVGGAGGAIVRSSYEHPPAVEVPTALGELNARLGNIASILGPVTVSWSNCPRGVSSEDLPPDVRVQGISNGDTEVDLAAGVIGGEYVEINQVVRYTNKAGQTVAYCGESIGDVPGTTINGPRPGTVVVIPNRPDCNLRVSPNPIPPGCVGAPFEYVPQVRMILRATLTLALFLSRLLPHPQLCVFS